MHFHFHTLSFALRHLHPGRERCHAVLLQPCWFAWLLPMPWCWRCLLGRPCHFLLRNLYCSQCLHHLLVLVLLRALGESCGVFSFLAVFRLRLSAGLNLEEDEAFGDELLVLWNWLQRIGVVALFEAPPVLGATRKQFPLILHRCLIVRSENCTGERGDDFRSIQRIEATKKLVRAQTCKSGA